MREIRISQVAYDQLMTVVAETGKSTSDVIIEFSQKSIGSEGAEKYSRDDVSLLKFVESDKLDSYSTSIQKYLAILSLASKLKVKTFDAITDVKGNKRVYFSTDKEAIRNSGSSTMPKAIPNTKYYAMSNTNSDEKVDILERALRRIGFTRSVAVRAAESL